MSLLKHIRRPSPSVEHGDWIIDCDCGWQGRVSCTDGVKMKPGAQVEQELEKAFKDHLPVSERIAYILVDTRLIEVPASDDEDAELVSVPRGNFLMPLGVSVDLLKCRTEKGVRIGSYLNRATGETGELPIGEVRTADNRVFKLDSDG